MSNGSTRMLSSPRPAVFLDRDGVINVDKGYVYRPECLEFIKDAPQAIAALNQAGYLTVVVTNQSGIARGLYSVSQMDAFHDYLAYRLQQYRASIDAFYTCPYHSDGVVSAYVFPNHPDRKPNPGMLLRAKDELNIDMTRSWFVGDKETDMEAAKAAGVKGLLFKQESLLTFIRMHGLL
jgi:D-glycero-D-manno-heptose 1,7-bisphosphate phosphatase